MDVPTKVLFPVPPPTTNSLTAQQRAQLLRSTNKLGKLLGATPHLIDANYSTSIGPLHIHLSFNERSSMSSRSSSDSVSSTSSSPASPSKSRSSSPTDPCDSWLGRKLPLLRITPPAFTLETIPASPVSPSFLAPPPGTKTRSHSRSSSNQDSRFTLRPRAPISPPANTSSRPSFTIPSISSMRRQKMDKLQRTLGERPPVDLVFPSESRGETRAQAEDRAPQEAEEKQRDRETQAGQRIMQTPGRISYTRDSMVSPSPHRAMKRHVVYLKASRPAPPPPMPIADVGLRRRRSGEKDKENKSQRLVAERERLRRWEMDMEGRRSEKLCSIVESPEESGSVGWKECASPSPSVIGFQFETLEYVEGSDVEEQGTGGWSMGKWLGTRR